MCAGLLLISYVSLLWSTRYGHTRFQVFFQCFSFYEFVCFSSLSLSLRSSSFCCCFCSRVAGRSSSSQWRAAHTPSTFIKYQFEGAITRNLYFSILHIFLRSPSFVAMFSTLRRSGIVSFLPLFFWCLFHVHRLVFVVLLRDFLAKMVCAYALCAPKSEPNNKRKLCKSDKISQQHTANEGNRNPSGKMILLKMHLKWNAQWASTKKQKTIDTHTQKRQNMCECVLSEHTRKTTLILFTWKTENCFILSSDHFFSFGYRRDFWKWSTKTNLLSKHIQQNMMHARDGNGIDSSLGALCVLIPYEYVCTVCRSYVACAVHCSSVHCHLETICSCTLWITQTEIHTKKTVLEMKSHIFPTD